MIAIKDFDPQGSTVVSGIYRVISGPTVEWNPRFQGNRVRIDIADYSGRAQLIVPPKTQDLELATDDVIQAIIRPRALLRGMGGTLEFARPLDPAGLDNLARVIPLPSCPPPAQDSLGQLVELWDELRQADLKRCLSRIFNRHYRAFLQAQGGWRYHHDYPGGLLVHSVSTALETRRQAERAYPQDRPRVEVIVAGALLHDLGKCRQILRGSSNPVLRIIPHAYLSLQMLGAELERLGRDWPQGGQLLTEILYWLTRPGAERPRGHDVELVHDADVIDVKADRCHRRPPLRLPASIQAGVMP